MNQIIIRQGFKLLAGFTALTLLLALFNIGTLDSIIFVEHFVFVILFVSQIVNIFRIDKIKLDPIKKKNAILFVILTALFLVHYNVVYSVIYYKARTEIRDLLSRINIEQAVVKLNGIEVTEKEKEDIAANLKQIKLLIRPNTSIINKTKCEIVYDGQNMNLIIKQNSAIRNEFLIYYPRYRATSRNSIGVFYSDIIDMKKYGVKD